MTQPAWWHEYSCDCQECQEQDAILDKRVASELNDTQLIDTSQLWNPQALETERKVAVTDRLPRI
jgi:hypothetical protein